MCNLEQFMTVLESFAPLNLSKKMIEKGSYDNSGIIVKHHQQINSVLFSLDLSDASVYKAIECGCDTIVTHHPAIYNPIKNLGVTGDTKALLTAVSNGINVISMHLNLDVAKGGIDDCLCKGLGGKNPKIIDQIDSDCGYGKEAEIDGVEIEQFVNEIKAKFGSEKIVFYGAGKVEKIASFCGGGASEAMDKVASGLTDADTIITSDMAHHQLLSLISAEKKVIIIPHYVSEEYGFKKFFDAVSQKVDKTSMYYFTDKRFM